MPIDDGFRFKQFTVLHDRSTMKVGTDAVLLASWVELPLQCQRILDVGTGCGLIALMMAQRSQAQITGIDIDADSIEQARFNASQTPWATRLDFVCADVLNNSFSQQSFDLIVSNPPFFEQSLKSPFENRNLSRHTDSLPFEALLSAVKNLLKTKGKFALILPTKEAQKVEKKANEKGLFCQKQCFVRNKADKEDNRLMQLFSLENCTKHIENMIIRNKDNSYTYAYQNLTKDFYLNF